MRMLKRLVVIALVVARDRDTDQRPGALPGHVLQPRQRDARGRSGSSRAGQEVRRTTRRRPGPRRSTTRRQNGVHVYGYDQAQGKVTVWTEAPVPGTLGWGPIAAAARGQAVQRVVEDTAADSGEGRSVRPVIERRP